jgi:hypothetical protein
MCIEFILNVVNRTLVHHMRDPFITEVINGHMSSPVIFILAPGDTLSTRVKYET